MRKNDVPLKLKLNLNLHPKNQSKKKMQTKAIAAIGATKLIYHFSGRLFCRPLKFMNIPPGKDKVS